MSTQAGGDRPELGPEDRATLGEILGRSAALGFLGGMPLDDQIDHSLGFVHAVAEVGGAPPDSSLDLGSGGGLPGLVVAAAWPTTRLTLLDASERRTSFLQAEVEAWGESARITVVRDRAEEAAHRAQLRTSVEVVTSRSFGSPAVTAECAAPLLVEGGRLVVSEPPTGDGVERWKAAALAELGLEPTAKVRYLDRYTFQVLTKVGPTPERYPRRVGVPAKRPLF